MKLDSLYWIRSVSESHDQSVRRSRGHFKRIGQTVFFYDQRVIPGRPESVRQAAIDGQGVVTDLRSLAVHQVRRPNDLPSKCFSDGLVSEADTKYRYCPGKFADCSNADACVRGHTRTRRNDYAFGLKLAHLLDCDRVIPEDQKISTQLTQILNKVISERVVVIYDKDHYGNSNME